MFRRFGFILLCAGGVFWSGATYADGAVLTRDGIEAFYAKGDAAQMMGPDAAKAFLEEHLHQDVEATLHLITNMQGMPPQKQTMDLNKEDVLEKTMMGYKMGAIESMESSVISVHIAEDGRSAKVKTSAYSVVSLSVPTMQGIAMVRSEQSTLCDDALILNAQNVIQETKSVCSAEANLAPVK